jgi:hypothetical protein
MGCNLNGSGRIPTRFVRIPAGSDRIWLDLAGLQGDLVGLKMISLVPYGLPLLPEVMGSLAAVCLVDVLGNFCLWV